MSRRSTQMLRILLVALACVLAACRPAPLPAERAIVILVSIDGFRWDYLDRHQAPNLARLAAQGVRSEGLIPQFPSKTFPNHYTIVTGLAAREPRHHLEQHARRRHPGGVRVVEPRRARRPAMVGRRADLEYRGEQGRIAAAMFWPGSETVIGGRQATFWKPFDDDLPHPERVGQVLAWLKLPEGKRPSFLTLYYSEVDNAGHDDGPESEAVNDAVRNVDRSLGELVAGVDDLGSRRSRALHRGQRSRHGGAQPRPHDRARQLHRCGGDGRGRLGAGARALAERRQRGKALRRAERQASAPRRVSEERDPSRVRPRRAPAIAGGDRHCR